jgi:galactonate dehydratase
MKITRIEARAFNGPITDLCFVRVFTDTDGLFGIGEASLPAKCPAVAQAVHDMAELVLGMDAMQTERVWQRMYRHSYWRGGPILTSAISGIDTALWDIRGKALELPVCALLGGPVRDEVRLYANIGLSTDPVELRDRALAVLALGYDAIKFYPLPALDTVVSARDLGIVERACEAVREAIGPDRDFALDFHGRCSPSAAVAIESRVRHTTPLWIEEPVAPENLPGLETCARAFSVPLAAGERWFTRWDFQGPLGSGAVHVIQPDCANAGGISEMARLGAMAETFGAAFAPHNPNGPVQGMASLHLAAAVPSFSILEHRFDLEGAFAEIADAPPRADRRGCHPIPDKPGLGIDVDFDRLPREQVTPARLESFRADGAVADW